MEKLEYRGFGVNILSDFEAPTDAVISAEMLRSAINNAKFRWSASAVKMGILIELTSEDNFEESEEAMVDAKIKIFNLIQH